jgi:hypothetical protein
MLELHKMQDLGIISNELYNKPASPLGSVPKQLSSTPFFLKLGPSKTPTFSPAKVTNFLIDLV